MPAPARVSSFVVGYGLDGGSRDPTEAERQLIEQALIDFMLDEDLTLEPARARVAPLLAALAELAVAAPPTGLATAALIKHGLIDLAAQLDRRENANLNMREHLVMLSEEIRHLRAHHHSPASDPTIQPGDQTC